MNSNTMSETSTMAEKEDFGASLDAQKLSRVLSEKEEQLPASKKEEQVADNRSISSSSVSDNDPEEGPAPVTDLERINTSDYPHSFKLVFIVLALVCSIFLVSLDMTIVATAIPKITDAFHSLDEVGW